MHGTKWLKKILFSLQGPVIFGSPQTADKNCFKTY